MPAIIKRLTAQGLLDVAYAANSLGEAALYEARQGVYTVSNTSNSTQTLLLGAHLDRLEDSARRENIPLKYDRQQLRAALRRMILDSGYDDARFRISVSAAAPSELLLSIEPFLPPAPTLIEQGTRCITASEVRHNPAAKTSDWMHLRVSLVAARQKEIYETFLVDARGCILEGLSSNFFAIQNAELRTADDGMLAGIARKVVLQICQGILPVKREAPRVGEISDFSEAFLTSSSRGIIPVVELDGVMIGAGKVGTKTLALRDAYQHWVGEHLEEL